MIYKMLKFCLTSVFATLFVVGSGASYADDMDDCQFFSPAYALCTIHAHNMGSSQNYTKGDEIQELNEIIALKSTVIAQQMKQQYDALNTMIKRLKTQLEKAVLTSKMEMITGNTSSSSGGGSSSYNSAGNTGLAGAEDCYAVTDQANVYDCFTRNLAKISQAVDNDLTGARKQLKNDIDIMIAYGINPDSGKCDNTSSSRNNMKTCVQNLQVKVRQAKTKFDQDNARARYGR